LDCILFRAYLGWQIETFYLKLSKMVISFYRNIVCKNIVCDMGQKQTKIEKHKFLKKYMPWHFV